MILDLTTTKTSQIQSDETCYESNNKINIHNLLFSHLITMEILTGTYHDEVPTDMIQTLCAHPDVLEKWNSLTPLARNEWICRVTIVKQDKTRSAHIIRLIQDI